ncbi:MAG TPA: hypothetical protein EYQ50_21000 [Verrucomicrobiales bacterium]|jgi:hypothetical protein|nr:hypothetical protein [Verrucomicrobiales bacterium]HIL69840.1 hypothetical protein [Verrucomicrobiota bacterium]
MKEPESTPKFVVSCRYLRRKDMYYEVPGEEDPDDAGEACWCNKTQESFGPDGEAAEKLQCQSGRSCFMR